MSEKPTCCCCFDIECGMKVLACLYVLGPILDLKNFLQMMGSGFWLFIILGLLEYGPRLVLAFFWFKWFRNDDTEGRALLVLVNKFTLIYYSSFMVIFLITLYTCIGFFLDMIAGVKLGGDAQTKETKDGLA